MIPLESTISSILDGRKQFIIPVYQRHYSWENEQCNALWKDIVNIKRNNREWHFVGSIVNITEQAMPTGVSKFLLIDGQQRLTTLTLLLIALRNYIESDSSITSVDANQINDTLLTNMYAKGEEKYKLILTDSDKETLINLIEKKDISNIKSSRLIDNYNFFLDKIKSKELDPLEIFNSMGKLQIVNITLDRRFDDAQAIFESLNSTGKELSSSDLIRNFVLMNMETTEQEYIYQNLWKPMESIFQYDKLSFHMDRFFRDYLTMKTRNIPNMERVYEAFKNYSYNCEFKTIRELCEDLKKYSIYYTNIVYANSDNIKLKSLYLDINELRMDTALPFLLRIHDDYAEKIITIDELIELIKLCISYVLRRNVCDYPSNSQNKFFASLSKAIKEDDYVNSIKAAFVLTDVKNKEFPDDEKFANIFMSRDIYNMRIRGFILKSIENYNNKSPIQIGNYTIEHIMPQNRNLRQDWIDMLGADYKLVQKNYLHTIGNLTLTAYNSEMSDKSFTDKLNMKGGFKESALRLNALVVNTDVWNESTIVNRAKSLADIALKIWEYPNISEKDLAPYTVVEDKVQYDLESYGLNDFNKKLFELLDRRICNMSANIKRQFNKLYVAYKLDTNFVDVELQKKALRLSLNMKFSEVYDPKGMCLDITNLGRRGNGDVEVKLEKEEDIDYIMSLIEQAYNLQADS